MCDVCMCVFMHAHALKEEHDGAQESEAGARKPHLQTSSSSLVSSMSELVCVCVCVCVHMPVPVPATWGGEGPMELAVVGAWLFFEL